jgi:hypothetical protein
LDVFRYHPSLRIVSDEKQVFHFENGKSFSMLPFYEEKEYLRRLKAMKDVRVLFTHTEFNGSRNNDGSKVECGINHKLFEEKFELTLSGHYHNQQTIAPTVYHLPSLLQNNFGESSEKGYTVLHDDYTLTYRTTDFKRFMTFKKNVDEIDEAIIERLKTAASDSNVRLLAYGDFSKLRKEDLKDLRDAGVRVEKAFMVEEPSIMEVSLHTKQSILNAWDAFCIEKAIEKPIVEYGKLLLK